MQHGVFSVTVPAETGSLKSLRAFFGSLLEDGGWPEAEKIVLAVDEACANLIKHRCAQIEDGRIGVCAELGEQGVRFRIGRFCLSGDVDRIKPRNLSDVRPGGLGTSFIAQIMDRIAYEEEEGPAGCMALVLEKRRTAVR